MVPQPTQDAAVQYALRSYRNLSSRTEGLYIEEEKLNILQRHFLTPQETSCCCIYMLVCDFQKDVEVQFALKPSRYPPSGERSSVEASGKRMKFANDVISHRPRNEMLFLRNDRKFFGHHQMNAEDFGLAQ